VFTDGHPQGTGARRRWRLVTLLVLAAVASPAAAQQADDRKGLWLGLGAGGLWARSTCSICAADQASGLGGRVRLGGTISPKVLASVEGTGWRKRGGQVERKLLMVAALGSYYPLPDYGAHLKGGIGQYWYVEEDATTELTTQGLALELGAGYDIRIASGVSVSPFVAWVRSGFGNPTRRDKASGFTLPLLSDMTVKFYQVGLGITLH